LVERCGNLKVGDAVDANSGMGPVVTKHHREKTVG
jgi:acyl-CoA reductase-like NAD-dependent aldehyde dehydrogenase